jgi:peptide deformylase
MELVLYPNPILRKRALSLAGDDLSPGDLLPGGEELRDRVREMFQIMYRERGVGLAAPQVGWSVRLFVANTKGEPDPGSERVYINPEISLREGEVCEEEGCLSIPGVRGKVTRSARIILRAKNLSGNAFEEDAIGLEARVLQHEFDHLDGILFLTRLSASDRMLAGTVLKKLERDYKNSLRAER